MGHLLKEDKATKVKEAENKKEPAVSHKGHRQRLKNRFINNGLGSFEPHNILELLLFFSIPRRDTNDTAHLLLEKFGSLSGVFDAPFSELVKVRGISVSSATLIKLILPFPAYLADRRSMEEIHSPEKAVEILMLI